MHPWPSPMLMGGVPFGFLLIDTPGAFAASIPLISISLVRATVIGGGGEGGSATSWYSQNARASDGLGSSLSLGARLLQAGGGKGAYHPAYGYWNDPETLDFIVVSSNPSDRAVGGIATGGDINQTGGDGGRGGLTGSPHGGPGSGSLASGGGGAAGGLGGAAGAFPYSGRGGDGADWPPGPGSQPGLAGAQYGAGGGGAAGVIDGGSYAAGGGGAGAACRAIIPVVPGQAFSGVVGGGGSGTGDGGDGARGCVLIEWGPWPT